MSLTSYLQMIVGVGNDSASHDSGSSAAEQGDAGPGAAIEHIVAARETAQALESLDSAQVGAFAYLVWHCTFTSDASVTRVCHCFDQHDAHHYASNPDTAGFMLMRLQSLPPCCLSQSRAATLNVLLEGFLHNFRVCANCCSCGTCRSSPMRPRRRLRSSWPTLPARSCGYVPSLPRQQPPPMLRRLSNIFSLTLQRGLQSTGASHSVTGRHQRQLTRLRHSGNCQRHAQQSTATAMVKGAASRHSAPPLL